MRLPTRIAIAAVAATAMVAPAIQATASAATSHRSTIAGTVPGWAKHAAYKGTAAGSTRVAFRLYLGWRNASQAEAVARAVSTPGSKSYHKFLSPAQFRRQFAPSQAQVTQVRQWLHSSGFSVTYTPSNNLFVAAAGTVAQANKAFQTTVGTYRYHGMTLLAPRKTLTVPSSLPAVTGIIGLDGTSALVHYDHVTNRRTAAPPSEGFRNATPLSAYWGEKTTDTTPVSPSDGPFVVADNTDSGDSDTIDTPVTLPHFGGAARPYATRGYTPDQLRAAYSLTGDETGAGQTVAVIDAYASPTIVQDVNTYYDDDHQGASGLYPQLDSSNFKQVVPPGVFRRPQNNRQDPQGWYGEETLDIEAVHAMAPQAKIVYVGAPNNYQDLDAALNTVVNRKLANIVTNSYGWNGEDLPRGFVKPVHDILVQGVAEGIGVYFSSGDNSDETSADGTTPPQADYPASDPLVTAVGGTSLAVGSTGSRLWEKGWATRKATLQTNDAGDLSWSDPAYLYGAGGGTSRLFTQPWYQSPTVTDGLELNHSSQPMRVVPDVSAVGDPTTGMRVGQTQAFPDGNAYDEYRIGGTSLSSPLMAGLMAVVQEARGSVIGFANPLFYAQAGDASATGAGTYYDVTPRTDPGLSAVRVDYVNGVDAADGLSASVRTIDDEEGLTIHVRPGYDDITGLGTPGATFVSSLAGATALHP